jgi:uncharacterized protein (TIGR02996 family)
VTHTDPTLRRLLAAVLADPADDTARLVKADALEDAGDGERAEFIRGQIAKVSADPAWHGFLCLPERPCKNCRRLSELWGEGAADPDSWQRRLMTMPEGVEVAPGGIRRGFVAEVRCTLAAFEAHAAALFAAQPIERVVLTDKQPDHVEREPGFGCWTWHNNEAQQTRYTLPRWLWALIPKGWFDSETDALDALSAALVTHGRRLARIDVPCGACGGRGEVDEKNYHSAWDTHGCAKCKGAGWVLNTGE